MAGANDRRKTALITGITGQDGSYLAELLVAKGYHVHGIKRRSSLFNTARIDHLVAPKDGSPSAIELHHGDLLDATNIIRVIQECQPDEIYNLAAMSHVHVSFETPEYTGNIDGLGTLRILEAVRILGMTQRTRIYHASTSELYGKVQSWPQNEDTPFFPRSPYGVAKLYAYWITKNYREAYDMFACNGILFNHESPRRGETFVTRKITRAVAEIAIGRRRSIAMGNLSAVRDWGHARDFVKAMWMMLQPDEPKDYVVSTGVAHSVRECITHAFAVAGITVDFEGAGLDEVARITAIDEARLDAVVRSRALTASAPTIGQIVVTIDPFYFRPTEVDRLLGDSSRIRQELGWAPETSFEQLVEEMVLVDAAAAVRLSVDDA
jgi:GDPmannose 4,6-dehydratase